MQTDVSKVVIIKDKDNRESKVSCIKKFDICPGGELITRITVSKEFEFRISDFIIDELPDSCYKCPCIFGSNKPVNCGRNTPFLEEDKIKRPSTCKLKTFEQFLKDIANIEIGQ